jgi:hypothetical protein
MLRWGEFAAGASATLYSPPWDADAIVAEGRRRSGSSSLRRVDAHTVRCVPGGVTFVPLPLLGAVRSTALLSVTLPEGVRAGELYRVAVQQLSGEPLRMVGAFELAIPVRKGRELLAGEERKLAVLRWIDRRIPQGDEWKPVFARYLASIEARVRGFGGDPTRVPASPQGGSGDQVERGCREALAGWLLVSGSIFGLLWLLRLLR